MTAARCPYFFIHLQVWFAALLDLLQVLSKPRKDFRAIGIPILGFAFQFVECKVDDVMMVEFFRRDLAAQVEPDAVQQLNFLQSQVGRVRAEIADVLLAARR
jgi:hypothetical protein